MGPYPHREGKQYIRRFLMKKMKLSTRLIGGFIVVAMITLVMGVFEIIQMKTIDKASTMLYEKDLAGLDNMAKWNASYLSMRIGVVYSIVNKFVSGREISEDIRKIKELDDQGAKALAEFEKTVSGEQERKLMDELKAEVAKYLQVRDETLKLIGLHPSS
jgi:methyl-accepting chemotaxis protein